MQMRSKLYLGAAAIALTSFGAEKAQAMSVQKLAEEATPVANEYGLYPSVMIAQGILESNSGQSTLASTYNNVFGVKYTSGTPVYLPTQEFIEGKMHNVVEPFQQYSSVAEACAAQARLLRGSFLYSGVWRENTSSYQDATAWLQGRYATDPNYASKLNAVIAQYGLTVYDGGEATQTSLGYVEGYSEVQGGISTYVVEEGDTAYDLANKFGVDLSTLLSENGLSLDSYLVVGTELTIPVGVESSAISQTYTVRQGDTLTAIAQEFGKTATELANINNISGHIYPGQVLDI